MLILWINYLEISLSSASDYFSFREECFPSIDKCLYVFFIPGFFGNIEGDIRAFLNLSSSDLVNLICTFEKSLF